MEFTILGGFLANLITTEGTPRATVSHFTVPKRDVLQFPRVRASIPVGEFGGKVRPPLVTGLSIWRPHNYSVSE